MKTQANHEGHRMVPKKMFSEGADEDARKRSRTEFKKCLAVLGLDISQIKECFIIISAAESEKFEMMEQIPDGFETWATIGMFMRDKPRVDQMYLRMSLRNSSHHVRSTLGHECDMEEHYELMRRLENRGKGKDVQPSTNSTVLLSPTALTNKALKRTRKNLFDAFLVAYYNSEPANTSPGMPMVIKHWRGVLDAYRVSLRLAGKHEYPKLIQHGDIFLKIMEQQVDRKRVNHITKQTL